MPVRRHAYMLLRCYIFTSANMYTATGSVPCLPAAAHIHHSECTHDLMGVPIPA